MISLQQNEKTIHISAVTRRKIIISELTATTTTTTTVTTTTLISTTITESTTVNSQQSTTHPVNNLTLLFDNLKLDNQEQQNTFFTRERIKIACFILILFVIGLFGVLVFLVFTLRKRFVFSFNCLK